MGLFKTRSREDVLQKKYEKLMHDWHKLASVNRAKSDEKYAEAQQVLEQIDLLKQREG